MRQKLVEDNMFRNFWRQWQQWYRVVIWDKFGVTTFWYRCDVWKFPVYRDLPKWQRSIRAMALDVFQSMALEIPSAPNDVFLGTEDSLRTEDVWELRRWGDWFRRMIGHTLVWFRERFGKMAIQEFIYWGCRLSCNRAIWEHRRDALSIRL